MRLAYLSLSSGVSSWAFLAGLADRTVLGGKKTARSSPIITSDLGCLSAASSLYPVLLLDRISTIKHLYGSMHQKWFLIC